MALRLFSRVVNGVRSGVAAGLLGAEDVSREVYATDGYDASTANLDQTSLDRDMVFSDGYSLQLATVTGSVDSGLTATLNVPV